MPEVVVSFTPEFRRNIRRLARRYRNIQGDVQPLIEQLAKGETPGDQISGIGHTVYKVRVKNSSAQRGKSGGYRVVYYLQTSIDITLITIYSKTDQGNISVEQIRRIIARE